MWYLIIKDFFVFFELGGAWSGVFIDDIFQGYRGFVFIELVSQWFFKFGFFVYIVNNKIILVYYLKDYIQNIFVMLELYVLFVNFKYDKDFIWMKEEVFFCLKIK